MFPISTAGVGPEGARCTFVDTEPKVTVGFIVDGPVGTIILQVKYGDVYPHEKYCDGCPYPAILTPTAEEILLALLSEILPVAAPSENLTTLVLGVRVVVS